MTQRDVEKAMAIAPKGLATVAFLKARMDEGFDHLALFEPLVFDALNNLTSQDFIAENVVHVVTDRTGLTIPIQTMRTLLGRCVKKRLLSRDGGRFFRTNIAIPQSRLETARDEIAAKQGILAGALGDFLTLKGLERPDTDNALTLLAEFISQNKVTLMLQEGPPALIGEQASPDRRLSRAIAEFIADRCLTESDLREATSSLLEGIVLVDVLLRRDIPETVQGFSNLQVYLDTSVLLDALGLCGLPNGVAANESLAALRQSGARTLTFTRTVDELRRVLHVYQQKLGTVDGRLSLHPTALTSHFLSEQSSPSDIKIISSTLESRLAKLGIPIKEFPKHIPQYTLNEKKLGELLINDRNRDIEQHRVKHDVDAVAAILTIRRDRESSTIERSVAILSTSSGRVIHSVLAWYQAEGQHGVPPIIHHQAITTLAWLKKPAAAPNVLLHELAATCIALMRPTRASWEKMTVALRRLRDQGHITDDETSAIVASDLMEPALASLADDSEPDSDSITEAIRRVRAEYRREASTLASDTIAAAHSVASRRIAEADRQAKSAQDELMKERKRAESQAIRAARAEAVILERCAQISSGFSVVLLFGLGLALVWGLWLTLPGNYEALTQSRKTVGFGALLVVAGWTIVAAIRGTTFIDIHRWLAGRVADLLVSRVLPRTPPPHP